MSKQPLRLLFHIGAGKTGTSSIQTTLRHGTDALRRQGVWYLGLNLEHAALVKYPWQVATGSERFHALDARQTTRELLEVLSATVAKARETGLHTLVWSNESFFARDHKTRPALHELIADGVDVQFVAYVRRHDAWGRSAYVQWAIKHKTNTGPVMAFRDWVKERPVRFAAAVQSVQSAFPGRLQLRNLDGVKDALADFAALAGIDLGAIESHRDNVTPSNEELLLRALFNARFKEEVLPSRYDRVFGSQLRYGATGGDYLRGLMPTADDLAALRESSATDRKLLDTLLVAAEQQPIATDSLSARPVAVNDARMVFALAQMVVQQAQRLERLEAALKRLVSAGSKD